MVYNLCDLCLDNDPSDVILHVSPKSFEHYNMAQGYESCIMLHATEHEISTAHINLNTDK